MESMTVRMLSHQQRVALHLADAVLGDLTDEEALWRPSDESWTVRRGPDGLWHADWEEPEPWPAPATSIAWIQWHVIWWWSTVLDRTFGAGGLRREDVTWPGASAAMGQIHTLADRWHAHLDMLTDADLTGSDLTVWPYTDGRAFGFVADWVNVELMKNVAEMCLLRRMTPHFEDGRFAR